jgi:threonine dehydrogenase-like Zn-dependent dehydrogenase
VKEVNFLKALLWNGKPFPDGFYVGDVEKPTSKKNWVSIKTKLCGICGSDMGIILGKMALADFLPKPLIFGHEVVGNIEEIGDNVEGFKVGDRVVVDGTAGCAELGLEPCDMCKLGRYSLCYNQAMLGGGLGYNQLNGGGFAEYFLAHKSKVYKVPVNVTDEEAALTEPLAVGIHSCFVGNPTGKKVAIIGAGAIGLQLLQTNKVMGAQEIFVAAEFEYQAELAEELGADKVYCLERGQSPSMEIMMATGRGVDLTYDGVGSAQTFQDAINITKPHGDIVFVGLMREAKIDFLMFNVKELTIHGINGYPLEPQVARTPFDIALEMEARGKINNKPLLTKTYKLEEWKRAFEAHLDKKKYKSTKIAFKYY